MSNTSGSGALNTQAPEFAGIHLLALDLQQEVREAVAASCGVPPRKNENRMHPNLTSLRRNTALVLSLAVFAAGGCGDDADGGPTTDGGPTPDGATADAHMNNPSNPAGLGPAPVELGATSDLSEAGSYVILAKTGITNVTGSTISGGHLGLSPAAASFITGFSLTLDESNTFATSDSVVDPYRIYASDYDEPTPTNLTSAVLAMEAAYTDAAARTTPDFLNLGSGDIGGETLAPGLYTWGSTVTIPEDVTISGGADDVWIFQISNDLVLSTDTSVLLAGGAQAENIFWQVAGQVTIHAGGHFEGIVLSQTAVTLQTNASMVGRALSQTLVAIDDNAITAP
jgi:hypothetical protein